MATFKFEAKAMNGKKVRGEVTAENETEAKVKLRAQKLIPIRIGQNSLGNSKPRKKTSATGLKVKPKELQIFTRQFAVLISSGVPILQSIESMASGTKSPGLTGALNDILLQLKKGKRLAEALELHPYAFDRMYVNLVKAGEEGGVLEEILHRLAEHIEKSVKLKRKMKGAMMYPIIIIFVAIVVISAILIFVIPSFVSMFEQNGAELPWLTQKVVQASHSFVEYWYLIFGGLFAFVMSIKHYYNTVDGRRVMDTYLIEVPILGDLIEKGAIASFARTLSTLLRAGVRIADCLDIAAATVGNWVIECAAMRAKASIEQGRTIADPLQKEKHIPIMVTQMVAIGEQTGNLDNMLAKVADFFEDEVETAADTLTSMMEPILMVVLGGIIAVLVIAMYLPIFKMADAVM